MADRWHGGHHWLLVQGRHCSLVINLSVFEPDGPLQHFPREHCRKPPPEAQSWPAKQNLLAIADSAQTAGVNERVNVIFHSPHLL